MMEVYLFLPQMRLPMDDLVERARAAEAAGFMGLALMDHLAPPLAEDQPMFEAMTTATWLAAATERLRVGHLVLCDAFRHPAVLARQAVSLDHASGGRFDLGLGWGSTPEELSTFGLGPTRPRDRVARLGETLAVIRALWSGEAVDHDGDHHKVTAGRQLPRPIGSIPLLIGGAGPRTMALVAEHADWWNVPLHALDQLDALRPSAGRARVSVQLLMTHVRHGADRDAVVGLAERRFGFVAPSGRVQGTGPELVACLQALAGRGVERVYAWLTDFAPPDSLAAFGHEVIAPLGAGSRPAPVSSEEHRP